MIFVKSKYGSGWHVLQESQPADLSGRFFSVCGQLMLKQNCKVIGSDWSVLPMPHANCSCWKWDETTRKEVPCSSTC